MIFNIFPYFYNKISLVKFSLKVTCSPKGQGVHSENLQYRLRLHLKNLKGDWVRVRGEGGQTSDY